MAKRKYDSGDTATVERTPIGDAQTSRLLGKTVRVERYEGNGWYSVKTLRGTKTYSLRAGTHI